MKRMFTEGGDMRVTLTPEDLRTIVSTAAIARGSDYLIITGAVNHIVVEFLEAKGLFPKDRNFNKMYMEIQDGNFVLLYEAAQEPNVAPVA